MHWHTREGGCWFAGRELFNGRRALQPGVHNVILVDVPVSIGTFVSAYMHCIAYSTEQGRWRRVHRVHSAAVYIDRTNRKLL